QKLNQGLLLLDNDAIKTRHKKPLELEPMAEFIKFEKHFKAILEEMMPYQLVQLKSANVRVRAFLINWLADNQAILQGEL
ncbi:MAG: hypothetical protein F6K31_24860, partial [Symploca sp. SIO2G7]|nr:hypothetical protein [Symploca sp. SIO2G7]